MEKEHILSEIKRTAEENSGIPSGYNRFAKETGINQWDWCGRYWSRWNEAIIEAGYTPNTMQSAYANDYLIQKLIELIQELGHFPTAPERRLKVHQDENFPSYNTFSRRFGKKYDLMLAVLSYCENHHVDKMVVEVCEKAIPKSKPRKSQEKETEPDFGFVYMMKSGKYFKIGKSYSVERRNYELGLKLPDELKTIHKIQTDDPNGIEAYWHKRFEEKRKGGEWFDLTVSDVKTFKRWRKIF